MKNKRKKIAVSEIVAVIILLGMSIAMYSVVQFMVFSYPFEPTSPTLNLVGSINEGKISIGHYGGESISIDSKIIITGDLNESFNASDDNYLNQNPTGRDDLWEIGEFLTYIPKTGFLKNALIHISIIDVKTNSVVMMGYIQEGST